MNKQPSALRLGVFAWESDLLEAEQLARGVVKWAAQPEISLVAHLIADGSLTETDIHLLNALWAEHTADVQQDMTRVEQPITNRAGPTGEKLPVDDNVSTLEASHRFELVNKLATGGLGKISVAIDRTLNRQVAIKEMLPRHAKCGVAQARFFLEAEITSQLEHPAVVPIHNLGFTPEGTPFYSMRLIEGRTIRDLTQDWIHSEPDGSARFASLAFRRLLNSFITVCHAVAHAHSRNIIHRDIKPANIVVGENGETMLVDWGLAKHIPSKRADESSREHQDAEETIIEFGSDDRSEDDDFSLGLSTRGAAIGTPAYMSPEQAAGSGIVGTANDIYSLGATLHFLLTGRPPVQGDTVDSVLEAVRSGKQTAPGEVCESVPRALDAICRHAMAFAPGDRYATPIEMAQDIERWLADEPVSVWRDSAGTAVRRWIRRHRVLSMAIGATVAASLIGTSLFSVIVTGHNRQLRIANEHVQAARTLADQQGALALETLRSVVGDIQKKLQHIPAAQRVRQGLLETSLAGLEKLAVNLANSTEIDQSTVLAHRELGDLFLEIGNIGAYQGLERARWEFQAAHSIAQALVDANPSDIEAGRQWALTVQRLADVESRIGSVSAAMAHRVLALETLESLHIIDPNNEQVVRSIGVAHNLLGDLYVQTGDYQNAGDHYLEAFRLREEQAARNVYFPESDRDLIVSLNKVAGHYSRIGNDQAAAEMFQRSLRATEALVDAHPGDFNALRDLSVVHYQLGKHFLKLRQMEQALEHLEASRGLDVARLALDPDNLSAQRDALESTLHLADALRTAGLREAAIIRSHEAIELGDRILMTNPDDLRAMRYLAYALGDLGTMLCDEEHVAPDLADYLPLFERCLALMTRAAELDSDNPRGQYDIAFAKVQLSRGLMVAERPSDSLTHVDQALTIQRHRCQNQPENLVALHDLVETLLLAAKVRQELEQGDSARNLFAEAEEAVIHLTEREPANAAYRDTQIHVLYEFGKHLQSCGVIDLARGKFEEALQIANDLFQSGNATDAARKWIDKLNWELGLSQS